MLPTKKITLDVQETTTGRAKKHFNLDAAKQIRDALRIYLGKFDVDQFKFGLNIDIEHGRRDPATDVTFE